MYFNFWHKCITNYIYQFISTLYILKTFKIVLYIVLLVIFLPDYRVEKLIFFVKVVEISLHYNYSSLFWDKNRMQLSECFICSFISMTVCAREKPFLG